MPDRVATEFVVDWDGLCAIHNHMLADVYDWAGEERTADIRKLGCEPFLLMSRIHTASEFWLDELEKDRLPALFFADRQPIVHTHSVGAGLLGVGAGVHVGATSNIPAC